MKQDKNGSVVIVIPGYMGSTLRNTVTGKKLWDGVRFFYLDYSLLSFDNFSQPLEQEERTVQAEKPVWPVYPGQIRHLRSNGFNVQFFPFDWRLSLNTAVEDLHLFIKNRFPQSRISFLTHSMGGLVASLWHNKYGKGRLDRFVFIGIPVHGADLTITMLLEGDRRFSKMNLRATGKQLQALAWQAPAMYEILPPLPGIYERKFWPGNLGIDESLLQQAGETRKNIDASFASLTESNAKGILIAGVDDKTVRWNSAGAAEISTDHKEYGPGDGWILQEKARISGFETYAFRRNFRDSFTLGLHYPGVVYLGSHPALTMFRRIHIATFEFLNDKEISSMPLLFGA